MTEKVTRPRCPSCGRVQAEWVTEAEFTCPRCNTRFEISSSCLSIRLKDDNLTDGKIILIIK